MKDIILKISEEDFDIIKKKLVCDGTVKCIKFDITEAQFRESPKFTLEYLRGELH